MEWWYSQYYEAEERICQLEDEPEEITQKVEN